MTVQESVGFTVIAQFAFSAHPNNWERIYDFGPHWGGSGQGAGVVLARQGTSNTLTHHLYPGGGQGSMEIDMGNEIQPNRQMTTVSTYQCIPAGVRYVRVQARRSYLQIGFLSVQTADGTNVALGKRASASGSYPGTDPSKAVNGPAGTRNHPVPYPLPLPASLPCHLQRTDLHVPLKSSPPLCPASHCTAEPVARHLQPRLVGGRPWPRVRSHQGFASRHSLHSAPSLS